MAEKKKKPVSGDLAVNRRAWHDYSVLEKIECGIVLTGTEVKVLLRSAEWTLVESGEHTGYLMNRFLAFEGEAAEAATAEEEQKVSVMLPAMVLAMDGGYALQINAGETDPEKNSNIILDGISMANGGLDIRGSAVTLRNCNMN